MRGSGRVKVHFRLAPDKSGYPPAASEFLWCMPTKRGSFIVDNIPFFAHDISLGDEISAEKVGKALHFSRVLRKSKNRGQRDQPICPVPSFLCPSRQTRHKLKRGCSVNKFVANHCTILAPPGCELANPADSAQKPEGEWNGVPATVIVRPGRVNQFSGGSFTRRVQRL